MTTNDPFNRSAFYVPILTYRTAAQIIAAADAQCRDGLRAPVSAAAYLDSLYICLQVAIEQKDRARGRELLEAIKWLERLSD